VVPVSQKRNLLSIIKASQCFSSTNAGKSEYLQCYVDIFILLAVLLVACKSRYAEYVVV